MNWPLWALILMAQNICFVITSRARNSSSVPYHAVASMFSNGVWVLQSMIFIDNITAGVNKALIATVYIFFTTTGALVAHYFAIRLERHRGIV